MRNITHSVSFNGRYYPFAEDDENVWPCFECSRQLQSSEELQQHLNEHDGDEGQTAAANGSKSTAKQQRKVCVV